MKPDLTLYLVTDFTSSYALPWLDSIAAAVDGGVTLVQYRNEEASLREQYEQARALQDMLRPRRVPLIINNHVHLALALDAEGVHIGQSDLPPDVVRRLMGPGKILGLSASNAAQVSAADPALVDHLGIGPVFPTQSKRNAPPSLGLEQLKALAALAPVPRVAIGGITQENAAAVAQCGVQGLAIVSALSRASDPAAAARGLRAAMC